MTSDLVVEGTVIDLVSEIPAHLRATNTELATAQPPIMPNTIYGFQVEKVLHGQLSATRIEVWQHGGRTNQTVKYVSTDPLLQRGDRAILFLRERETPLSNRLQYVWLPGGRLDLKQDGRIAAPIRSAVTEKYQGKDRTILEKDILEALTRLPPSEATELSAALSGAHLVIEATIKEAKEVRLIPEEGKSEDWIKQMLSEGKMPGDVYTDYVVAIDKVLFDKFADQPRFLPDRKPLEPGQTIVVTWRGGTYEGVTQTYERGIPFEIGSREVLFLQDMGVTTGDPDYHSSDYQVRYSLLDSVRARLLIGHDGVFAALDGRGLSDFYAGQSVEQLEKDLAEFLKAQPPAQTIPAPAQP